jgi:hypothetical protein
VPSDPTAAALITAAVGEQPAYRDGAWVWANVRHSGHAILISTGAFTACIDADPSRSAGVLAVARCVVDDRPTKNAAPTDNSGTPDSG